MTKKEARAILLASGIRGLSRANAAKYDEPFPASRGWKRRVAARISGKSADIVVRFPKAKKTKSANQFYKSWDWKQARYGALKAHGHRCLCCGWSPDAGGVNHLVVDHIKPRSLYPQLELVPSNLQVLCNDCNMGKSNKHEDDFRDARAAD